MQDDVVAQAAMIPKPLDTLEPNRFSRPASVTVCLVTHNRPHYVRSCLASLRQQTVGQDGFDIIVVDSCGRPEVSAELARLVAEMPNTRLLRVDRPGVSAARNCGAEASTADFVAFLDDDALAAPDWVERIQQVALEQQPWPGVIGGQVLPVWESPLPDWWPVELRGVLSIIEWEGRGEFRTEQVPDWVEPYGVNMIVQRQPLLDMGGFADTLGRVGELLLSDEDVQVGWRLQDRGYSAWYDSRVVVHHQIQAARMRPEWLINRLYWQGASTVATRRILGSPNAVWRELPRRLLVELLTLPASLLPNDSTTLLGMRWRLAYARGFTRMALMGEQPKRSLPGRLFRALIRRDGQPIIPTLDSSARAGEKHGNDQ